MVKGVFTGSFDPIQLGHIDIIKRAAKLCDELTVAVTINLQKQGMFSFEERRDMVLAACSDIPNLKVDICTGLRADYVNNGGFDIEFKSLRNSTDFDYEIALAQMHAKLYKKTETVFLMTNPAYSFISSNQVRQVYSLGGDVSFMVAPSTLKYMDTKFKR